MSFLLEDAELEAANLAYTIVLFPECSERSLKDEWARMPAKQKSACMAAMRAAITAALAPAISAGWEPTLERALWSLRRIANMHGSAQDLTPHGRGYNAALEDCHRVVRIALGDDPL